MNSSFSSLQSAISDNINSFLSSMTVFLTPEKVSAQILEAIESNNIDLIKSILPTEVYRNFHIEEMANRFLFLATQKNRIEIISLFLSYNYFNVNSEFNDHTFLEHALDTKNVKVIKVLLSDPNLEIHHNYSDVVYGNNILMKLIQLNDLELLKLFLTKRGTFLDFKRFQKEERLMIFSFFKELQDLSLSNLMVEKLPPSNFSIRDNEILKNSLTLFSFSIQKNWSEMIEILLNHHDVDCRSALLKTAIVQKK